MKFIQANVLSFIVLGLMIIATLILYGEMPARIPTNYDFNGVSRSDTSKELIAVLLPSIYLLIIIVVNILVKISPEKFSMPNSKRAMDIIIFGSGLLMACIHLGLLTSANDFAKFEQYLAFGLAMFLIVVGNVLGKTERNFFIGIRLPWTLASEENWRATHRLAGKLMVIFGLLLLGSAFFVQNVVITVVLSTSPLIIPVFYSYFYYARKEKKHADDIQTTRHRL